MAVTLLSSHYKGYNRLAFLRNGKLTDLDAQPFPSRAIPFPCLDEIHWGRVISVSPGQAFVKLAGNHIGLLPHEQLFPKPCEGQPVLVQVRREPIPDKGSIHKGPLLTRRIIFGGRYCLFHPFLEKRLVSPKINNADIQCLLENMVPPNAPFTLREACADAAVKDIQAEMQHLQQKFTTLEASRVNAPCRTAYDALPPLQRWMRDLNLTEVQDILVDHDETFRECRYFLQINNPSLMPALKRYAGSPFEAYRLEDEWDALFEEAIPLHKGGASGSGNIVIETTAAAIVIDVNQGGMPARETNEAAVTVLVQQLKWRHLGGNILIDFAGVNASSREKTHLSGLLSQACEIYGLPLTIMGWSGLGWLEARLPKRRLALMKRVEVLDMQN